MEKLRSEIQAAFEKEQAAHPPITALRRNVVEEVTAHPRRDTNYQWLAVAAALVLGILVVVGLLSTRLARLVEVPAHHQILPSGEYGPPPDGVPLLYVHDPRHSNWLIGYDWSGKPRGTVKFDESLTYLQMAPDGSMFGGDSQRQGKGGFTQFFDRLGKPIWVQGSLGDVPVVTQMWADDNLHLCAVSFDQKTNAWTFVTQLPGENRRRVGTVSTEQGIGQTSISLASCSFRNDQAFLFRIAVASVSDFWVIRISDGKIIKHRDYRGLGQQVNIVASSDANWFAESWPTSTGKRQTFVSPWSDPMSVVKLAPDQEVLAFSGDGSLVLVATSPWVDGVPTHLAVVDFRSSRVLWTYEGQEVLGGFLAQPDGNGFAISLKGTGQGQDRQRDILIVSGDGTETKIPDRYQPAW